MPPKKREENLEGKIESILEKLDVICTGRSEDKRKLDEILKQTTVLQNELANLNTEVKKLQEDLSHVDKNITDIQKEMELKTSIADFEKFKEEILRKADDLENRSKRNNLVFWNIPEGEEKGRGCRRLIEDIIMNHMKLKDSEDIVIARAHRTNLDTEDSRKKSKDKSQPRPIHCNFLHWEEKEYIIKRAPGLLKNNPYGVDKSTIIVTDDVSKRVRDQRKVLRAQYLPKLREKPSVKVAFVPYIVPARIQYKEGDTWKFFYLPSD